MVNVPDQASPSTTRKLLGALRHPRRTLPAVRRRVVSRVSRKTPESRRRLILANVDVTGLGLEIGPSYNPLLPKSEGYRVRTADHLDRAGLVAKYEAQKRATDRVEEVDYVLDGGRLASIEERFDYIVASHVIEHTVCLVTFLQDCATLLRPGGVLVLAIPDQRYCFDRFRERTGLARVVDAYRAGASAPTEGSVLEHFLCSVRREGRRSWPAGFHGAYQHAFGRPIVVDRRDRAVRGEHIDVHTWVFTPNHFRLLVRDLAAFGYITLREKAFHDTHGSEFYVTMSAEAGGPPLRRPELVRLAAAEASVREPIVFA